MAKECGSFPNFAGSEFSRGRLQMDFWDNVHYSGRYDWDALLAEIIAHGTRNALLTACIPTVSTSQIVGYSECFEPINSIFYVRKVLSGEFVIVNQHLMRQLHSCGLWSETVKNRTLGEWSIQGIAEIPEDIKRVFKTAYEIKMKLVIDLAVSRGPFIDQTQGMNQFGTHDTTLAQISSALMYAHAMGLKTGCYYYRQMLHWGARPRAVVPEGQRETRDGVKEAIAACRMEEGCLSCST